MTERALVDARGAIALAALARDIDVDALPLRARSGSSTTGRSSSRRSATTATRRSVASSPTSWAGYEAYLAELMPATAIDDRIDATKRGWSVCSTLWEDHL